MAFSGPRESGKTTAASYVETALNADVLSFASPLKSAALMLTGPLPAQYTHTRKEEVIPGLGFSWRQVCNFLGDGARQSLSPDIWVNIMRRELAGRRGLVVIDDLRYPNEAAMVRELGGVVIGVRRPATWNAHPHCPIDTQARTVVNSADYVIHNHQSVLVSNEFVDEAIGLVAALLGVDPYAE